MLFRNLYIENAEKLQDIRVEEGVITEGYVTTNS